jgi:hypothetical protein
LQAVRKRPRKETVPDRARVSRSPEVTNAVLLSAKQRSDTRPSVPSQVPIPAARREAPMATKPLHSSAKTSQNDAPPASSRLSPPQSREVGRKMTAAEILLAKRKGRHGG